jgi:23S rRNA (pseudouridine1915-N3)-methyltransferase
MKITLLQIGKTHDAYIREGIAEFEKRLSAFTHFTTLTLPAIKEASSLNSTQVKQKEAKLLLDKIKPEDFIVLLDENGKTFTSETFARQLESWQNQGTRSINFIIGGAYGFAPEIYQRASSKIALSSMTFSHQMVRLIFVEQLYRAYTIIHKHPYHNPS